MKWKRLLDSRKQILRWNRTTSLWRLSPLLSGSQRDLIGSKVEIWITRTFTSRAYHKTWKTCLKLVCLSSEFGLLKHTSANNTLVHHVMKAVSTKSCPLDPMTTRPIIDYFDHIVPVNTASHCWLVCFSLVSVKHSLVRPLLKQSYIHQDKMKSCRPRVNISFLSNIIKEVVVLQI